MVFRFHMQSCTKIGYHVIICKITIYNYYDQEQATHITQYGSTVYIGIAMVFVFSPYIRKIQFLLSVSSHFNF